jgi:hypothetical protein
MLGEKGAVMTTLDDVTKKKSTPPSAEEAAAAELVRLAKEQGLSLTGPDGLLKQFTKTVLETALNEEMTEHLGHDKNQAKPDRESTNIRRRHPVEDGADRVDRSGPDRSSQGPRSDVRTADCQEATATAQRC